jgi:CheY-like chemotaxis protein
MIVLDLNMPISDGFDTCKKIVTMYNQVIIKQGIIIPYIVACSSHIDSDIQIKVESAGFDKALQNPISQAIIQHEIIPLMFER